MAREDAAAYSIVDCPLQRTRSESGALGQSEAVVDSTLRCAEFHFLWISSQPRSDCFDSAEQHKMGRKKNQNAKKDEPEASPLLAGAADADLGMPRVSSPIAHCCTLYRQLTEDAPPCDCAQKRHYRQRAHANPLSIHHLE